MVTNTWHPSNLLTDGRTPRLSARYLPIRVVFVIKCGYSYGILLLFNG